MNKAKLALIILDGLGYRKDIENNAVALAKTPYLDKLSQNYPKTLLKASGAAVGLPENQMGNSEVGHLSIGAGRIVRQSMSRINYAIQQNEFDVNSNLQKFFYDLKTSGQALHLVGLLSDGGVHSHKNHLFSLLKAAKKAGLSKIYVHVITDGRDVAPRSARNSVMELEEFLSDIGVGKIASLMGRYYAMDRDRRYERTQKAYEALVLGIGQFADSPLDSIEDAYAKDQNDEFIKPYVFEGSEGILPNDGILFYNFRTDRMRQLLDAVGSLTFKEFPRDNERVISSWNIMTMTDYGASVTTQVLFPTEDLEDTLGEIISKAGLTQLRLAETEKFPHVTYFMNGGRNLPFKGESRELIDSPKVATYDLKPEMSAPEIADAFLRNLATRQYDVFIINFANPDMVGHSGDLEATIKAVETIDHELERVVEALSAVGAKALIFADHGNAETMFDAETIGPHTAHTTVQVPFIVTNKNIKLKENGSLVDIAATTLDLLGIEAPQLMTGQSLIEKGE